MSRTHYWSCSKFADWIRGMPKGEAKTSKGWNEWRKLAEETHPFRYWLAEEVLDHAQKVVYYIPDTLHSIKYYINNRWVTRTHSLTAHPSDIKPGHWCDVGNRFLPCLFNELVDFVEIEEAWSNIAWDEEARKKFKAPFYSSGWFRWRTWRCPEAGIEKLKWAASLTDEEWLADEGKHQAKPTQQALNAIEILYLYNWWTKIRPMRMDPHVASGWSELCDQRRASGRDLFDFEDRTEEEKQHTREVLDRTTRYEEQHNKEDEEMMIRLIRVRHSLWT